MTHIDELLTRLTAADIASAEAALVRLTILGARIIEPLLESYDEAPDAARGRMLRLLERVPDRRALPLLRDSIAQGSTGLRRLAVRALGAQRADHILPILLERLRFEEDQDVRSEVVSILARLAAGETPEALDPVLDVLFDPQQPGAVRRAALTALAGLTPRQSLKLLRRLADQGTDVLSRDVRQLLENYPEDPMRGLPALMTEPPISMESAQAEPAANPLMNIPHVLSTLETHGDDPETAHRCTRALETLSVDARRDLAGRLDARWPLPVMDGVLDTFRGVTDALVLSAMAEWTRSLAERLRLEPDPDQQQQLSARRGRAHLLIAQAGSRLAIGDLKEALRETDPMVHNLVRALAAIGRGEDLATLLGAHDQADAWMQHEILMAAGTIMRREKPRRRSRILASLPDRHAVLLRKLIMPPESSQASRRRAPGPGETP